MKEKDGNSLIDQLLGDLLMSTIVGGTGINQYYVSYGKDNKVSDIMNIKDGLGMNREEHTWLV
jgi:hypothetical protein